MPTYLTIHEVAERWRYETDKPIYEMKDKIGFMKIRGKILFLLENVERYERENTITPDKKKVWVRCSEKIRRVAQNGLSPHWKRGIAIIPNQ